MEEKKQFDELLGGSEKLPKDAHILKLAAARSSEIAAMTYSLENPQYNKLIFQRLPIHMRRRVMSHNAKRMPRKLRNGHLKQMAKSGLPPKTKRPSRKYRRRPSNLLSEYNRRKKNKIWLETHIWHAKRFKMIEKWGYKLANHPNDRCFKACYRAVMNHCLLQDVSYYNCIELRGPFEILKQELKLHCNPNELTFSAKVYTKGQREGMLMFYKKNRYPFSPIGRVSFMWNPIDSNLKTIWIWVHPSFYNELSDELISSFNFLDIKMEVADEKLDSLNENPAKLGNSFGCEMKILQNSLNRFSLCGPLTLGVICSALKVPTNTETLFSSLKTLKSPNQLPPNIILGFTVLDPRFFFSNKRIKSFSKTNEIDHILLPPISASLSSLWDEKIRSQTSQNCPKTCRINDLRSKNLVPGVKNDQFFNEAVMEKIPILLVQKPGKNCGFGSGIDIILPAGWSMPFWMALILRMARPGGLREAEKIAFENSDFKALCVSDPDSKSYKIEAICKKNQFMNHYFRRPPNRRVNYIKYAISSPFFCEWEILMNEWTSKKKFYVLRDRKTLKALSEGVEDLITENNCLIPVKISLLRKGLAKDFGMICLPTSEDLEKFKKNIKWSGPIQTPARDVNEAERKTCKKNHQALLKRLRRQRTKAKKTMEDVAVNLEVKTDTESKHVSKIRQLVKKKLVNCNSELLEKQAKVMENLYLPECKKVRNSCDREIIGYITKGGFSYSEAKGVGLGYVVLPGLLELLRDKTNFVLARNPTTKKFRMCKLEIVS